jgi:hypothetical protein
MITRVRSILFYNHCGIVSVHHIPVVTVGGHFLRMTNHALAVGTYGTGQPLVLKRLLVIPMQPVLIHGPVDRMGGSVTCRTHDPVVIGTVPVECFEPGHPAVERGAGVTIIEYIEIGMARPAVGFHQPGHTGLHGGFAFRVYRLNSPGKPGGSFNVRLMSQQAKGMIGHGAVTIRTAKTHIPVSAPEAAGVPVLSGRVAHVAGLFITHPSQVVGMEPVDGR